MTPEHAEIWLQNLPPLAPIQNLDALDQHNPSPCEHEQEKVASDDLVAHGHDALHGTGPGAGMAATRRQEKEMAEEMKNPADPKRRLEFR